MVVSPAADAEHLLPADTALRHAAYELAQLPGDGLALAREFSRVLKPRNWLEQLRETTEQERAAKHAIDRAFASDGFVSEQIEMQRLDETSYPNTILYRRGDAYPERAIILSHGFTAGYESLAPVIGSELRDFTLLLHHRPGVDRDNAAYFNQQHHPRLRFLEQMHAQRQAAELAINRGASEVVLAGHSMSGMITLSNVCEPKQWSPELRAALHGSILLNSPAHCDVVDDSHIGQIFRPVSRALLTAADHPGLVDERLASEVTRFLASSEVVNRMLGEITDDTGKAIYLASKYRAKQTHWRSLIYDLHCMRHVPTRSPHDHLIGLSHLVITGGHDRLVTPHSSNDIVKLLSTKQLTGERNVTHHLYPDAGHFPHASHRGEVNQRIYEFVVGLPERESP